MSTCGYQEGDGKSALHAALKMKNVEKLVINLVFLYSMHMVEQYEFIVMSSNAILSDATTTDLVDILLHPLEEQDIETITKYQNHFHTDKENFPRSYFMSKLDRLQEKKKIQEEPKSTLDDILSKLNPNEPNDEDFKYHIQKHWKTKETSLEDKLKILEKLQQENKMGKFYKLIKELMHMFNANQETVLMQAVGQKNYYNEIVIKILLDYLDEDRDEKIRLIIEYDPKNEENMHNSLTKAMQFENEEIFKLLLSNLKKYPVVFSSVLRHSKFYEELKNPSNVNFYNIFKEYVNELDIEDLTEKFNTI
jgi:hypothetical protein